MECQKVKNLLTAKEEGKYFLQKYIESKDRLYLQKAMDIDNTNSETLYYYLNDIKSDIILYNKYLSLYRPFINKEFCDKLEIEYTEHKNDVRNVLYSIKDIEINKLDTSSLKKALKKYIPRNLVTNLSINGKNKVNNMPLDLNNENMFYLTIKLLLGERLYPIIDAKIGKNDEFKNEKIKIKKKCLSYIKVLNGIFIYYLDKEEKETIYKLLTIIDFNERQNAMTRSRISYYLDQIGKDKKEILDKTGYELKEPIQLFPKFQGNFDKFKELFFALIEKILKSKCIKELIINLKTHYNDNDDIIKIDNNYIQFIKKNTIFTEFFDINLFGITSVRNLKTFINIEYRDSQLDNELTLLFNFCICIITGVHEYIEHLLKDYYYYSSNYAILHQSPKIAKCKVYEIGEGDKEKQNKIENEEKKEKEEKVKNKEKEKEKEKDKDKCKDKEKKEKDKKGEDKEGEEKGDEEGEEEEEEGEGEEKEKEEEGEEEEGGFHIEKLLFNKIRNIYLCDVLYILDIKNWEKSLNDFVEFFKSEKRNKLIDKGDSKIKYSNLSKECLKICKCFNIEEDQLYLAKKNISMEFRKSKNSLPYMIYNGGCGAHRKYKLF